MRTRPFTHNRGFGKIKSFLAFKFLSLASFFFFSYSSWENSYFMRNYPLVVPEHRGGDTFLFVREGNKIEKEPDYLLSDSLSNLLEGDLYWGIWIKYDKFILQPCNRENENIFISQNYFIRPPKGGNMHNNSREENPLFIFYRGENNVVSLDSLLTCFPTYFSQGGEKR